MEHLVMPRDISVCHNGHWYLMDRDQGCVETSYNAEEASHYKELSIQPISRTEVWKTWYKSERIILKSHTGKKKKKTHSDLSTNSQKNSINLTRDKNFEILQFSDTWLSSSSYNIFIGYIEEKLFSHSFQYNSKSRFTFWKYWRLTLRILLLFSC